MTTAQLAAEGKSLVSYRTVVLLSIPFHFNHIQPPPGRNKTIQWSFVEIFRNRNRNRNHRSCRIHRVRS